MKKIMWWVAFIASPFLTLFLVDILLIGKNKAPVTIQVEVKAQPVVVASQPTPKITTAKLVPKTKPQIKAENLDRMIDKLIPALIQVESNGRDWIIGDRDLEAKAYGCLQIRQPCLEDVNRLWRTSYKAEEMNGNRPLSVKVCRAYLRYWGGRLKDPTPEALARIWNGGPSWQKYPKTVSYWAKVKGVL